MSATPPPAGLCTVLCATQRTGSTMIVEDLCLSLGAPPCVNEALYAAIVAEAAPLGWAELWPEIAARSRAGPLGCHKVMFHYLPAIAAVIGGRPRAQRGPQRQFIPALCDDFVAFFRAAIWVHIRRRDVFAQAVSLYFAEATGAWQAYADTPRPAAQTVRYDAGRMQAMLDDIRLEDAAWQRFFAHYGIAPLAIFYEDAVAHYPSYLTPLLAQAGLAMVPAPAPRHIRKLGGAEQARFAALLRADVA
jgi:hypothetical protein